MPPFQHLLLSFSVASFPRAVLGDDCPVRALLFQPKNWIQPMELILLPPPRLVLRQDLSPGLQSNTSICRWNSPVLLHEKYLRFLGLPAQLRCFPRDAAASSLLHLGVLEREKSDALVPPSTPRLSSFLAGAMSLLKDVLACCGTCFGNNPSQPHCSEWWIG